MTTFKYAIGDVVGTSLHVEEITRFSDTTQLGIRPQSMYVEERLSIECIGGTQLFYACRCMDGATQRFPEAVLVKAEVVWDAWADGVNRQEARKNKL